MGIEIPIIRSIPRPDFIEFGTIMRWIPGTPDKYDKFVSAVILIAKRCIPRG